MKPSTILKRIGIDPDKPVLLITAEEAIENILCAVREYCPPLKISKMGKKDIETLLFSYHDCVINYHPENYHQERGAILENFEMLKSYGLRDYDFEFVDFY